MISKHNLNLCWFFFSLLVIFLLSNFTHARAKITESSSSLINISTQSIKIKSSQKLIAQNNSIILNNEILKNSAYFIKNSEDLAEKFKLKNGITEIKYGMGVTEKLVVTLIDSWIRQGDLDQDGIEDAVVILAYSGGGSGTFIYLALVLNQQGEAVNVATEFLGDRITIKSLSVEKNQILISWTERNSQKEIAYKFNLEGENLVKEKLNSNNTLDKINFDISLISPDGLIGSSDNLRSVSYEFCIPKNPQSLAEVQKIAPEISFSQSKGRIGCTENQYLCIGDTHNPNWLEILKALSHLDYIQKIERFFGE